jgi:predicted ATPase with chaperone activity
MPGVNRFNPNTWAYIFELTPLNFYRARESVLKVARALADLVGAEIIRPPAVLEAIQFRSLDRKLFS